MNKLLLLSTILLMALGCVVVYTSSAAAAMRYNHTPEYYLILHCKKVIPAFVIMLVVSKIDFSVWKKLARWIFLGGCALTLVTICFGEKVNGAARWFYGIQPSEILKFGFVAMLSLKLSEAGNDIKTLKGGVIQPCIPFVISALLLGKQPNYSMVAVFAGITLALLFVAGTRWKYLSIGLGGGLLAGLLALLINGSHVIQRFNAFMHPEENRESAHQLLSSLAALGNGGLTGTGIGMGMQKLGYLPESHKDVVYSVIGEEMGFMGTSLVLLLFTIMFYQGFEIAKNKEQRFGKYLALAFTITLFLNVLIHVCVCTGLCPTTGQPLPFLSFGGTNLFFSCAAVGVLLNISKNSSGSKIVEPTMDWK